MKHSNPGPVDPMKNYWLKIVLGAFGVFAVGMVLVALFRKGAVQVNRVVDSAEPISIPLAFVPFKLNGERVGTINHLKLIRSAPKHFEGADLEVTLADSFNASRLGSCILVAERITQINERSTFRCAAAKDTVGRDLALMGTILVRGGERYPFLVPRAELQDLNDNAADMADSVAGAEEQRADSIAQWAQEWGDSVAEHAQNAADSAMHRAMERERPRIDSIRNAALQRAESIRASVRRRNHLPNPHPDPRR